MSFWTRPISRCKMLDLGRHQISRVLKECQIFFRRITSDQRISGSQMTLILIGNDLLSGGKTKGLNGFQASVWHFHQIDHEVITHLKWLGPGPTFLGSNHRTSKDDWGVLHHLQNAYYLHHKSRWHSYLVLVYISLVFTYLLKGTVPCILTMG